MAAAALFLLVVQMTPSRLILKLPCDSERSTSSDFTLQKRKLSTLAILSKFGVWQFVLTPSPPLKSPGLRWQCRLSHHHRNTSWDDNPDLFGLKIGWGIARAFGM
jgi:hypothetical protein